MDRVFIDSDVIIASLLSPNGVSNVLLSDKSYQAFISSTYLKELKIVCKRMGIKEKTLQLLINSRLSVIPLPLNSKENKLLFNKYTKDPNDTHIVAGAVKAKANFLITYNIKHFKINMILSDFDILVLSPALYLQYKRSQN